MSWKHTWILTGLAAAMLAAILFLELPPGRNAGGAPAAGLLMPDFDAARVTGIEIIRTNAAARTNYHITAQKTGERWALASPAYPAVPTAIERFLEALGALKQHSEIPAEDLLAQPNSLAAYGLAPPQASLTLQSGTNRVTWRLGLKTLHGGQMYVQRIGGATVQVADAALLQHLPETASDWRQPTLLPMEGLSFDRMTLTNGPRVVELYLDQTNRTWNLRRPMPGKADVNQVLAVAQQLRLAQVSKFISTDPRSELDSYGLLAPEVSVALSSGTNTVFQVQFGRSPTNDASQVYAYLVNYNVVALLPAGLAEFLRKPYKDFRDKTLLSFSTGAVARIEVEAQGESWAAQREGTNAWKIAAPFQAPADAPLMQQFLENLGRLQVERFEKDVVTDFSTYGLAQPARRYALGATGTNAASSLLAQVDFSVPMGNVVFARRTNEFGVYAVVYSEMLRLPRAAFEVRDRRLWNFAPNNVAGVAVHQRGRSRELRRQPGGVWSTDAVVSAAIEETVTRLGSLQALEWADKGEAALKALKFPETDYRIVISEVSGGRTNQHTLSFGMSIPRRHVYASTILEEGQPVIFRFPIDLYGNVAEYLSVPAEAAEIR